jgi:ankyrin repeat protein
LLLEWDGSYINDGMQYAAEGGHTDIVRLLIENGATDFKSVVIAAAENGHIAIIKLFKEWNVIDDMHVVLFSASRYGHTDVVMLCKEYLK